MTPGTQAVFESARQTIVGALSLENASLTQKLRTADLLELARQIPEDNSSEAALDLDALLLRLDR